MDWFHTTSSAASLLPTARNQSKATEVYGIECGSAAAAAATYERRCDNPAEAWSVSTFKVGFEFKSFRGTWYELRLVRQLMKKGLLHAEHTGGAHQAQNDDVGGGGFLARVSPATQAVRDGANQGLSIILHLIGKKLAALLMTKHAQGARKSRGSGLSLAQGGGVEILEDNRRDDTCDTRSNREYELDAGTRP